MVGDAALALNKYPLVCRTIKQRLEQQFSGWSVREGVHDKVSNTLWMISQVEGQDELNGSTFDQGKIDRWIGWVMCAAFDLGVISNEEERLLVRRDLENFRQEAKTT